MCGKGVIGSFSQKAYKLQTTKKKGNGRIQNMAMSKKGMESRNRSLKLKLKELEEKAADDPLKRNWALHEEIEKLKKKLA
jgi:hypothetical protein